MFVATHWQVFLGWHNRRKLTFLMIFLGYQPVLKPFFEEDHLLWCPWFNILLWMSASEIQASSQLLQWSNKLQFRRTCSLKHV